MAYTKLDLKRALLESDLPDDPFAEPWLREYVPDVLVERFADHLDAHPLRRQLIATGLVNELVNRGGITYAMRAGEETGAGPAEVARAFATTCGVFDLRSIWKQIDAQEGQAPPAALTALRSEVQRLLDRSTRWLLQTRGGRLDVPAEVARFRGVVAELADQVPAWLIGVESDRLQELVTELVELGAPTELAEPVAALLDVFALLYTVEISTRTGEDPAAVTELYFTVSERWEVDLFLTRITGLPRHDRWSALARASLRSDLYGALAAITAQVVRTTPEGGTPQARVQAWEQHNAEGLARARAHAGRYRPAGAFRPGHALGGPAGDPHAGAAGGVGHARRPPAPAAPVGLAGDRLQRGAA